MEYVSRSTRPDAVGSTGQRNRRIPENADRNLSRRPCCCGMAMRIAPAVAAVPFLILLLTWLSVRAIDTDAERLDLVFGEMDNFGRLEAALHRDVLSARAGVLRNYDPLVQEVDALAASLARF